MPVRRIYDNGDTGVPLGDYCSDWMLVTNNADLLKAIPPQEPEADNALHVRLWTDHYSNLFQSSERD